MSAFFHLDRCFVSISKPSSRSARAFTRLELAAVVAALMLLAAVALPLLANTKPRVDRVTCVNNLRLIGRAEHLWANDHHDVMPWRVDITEGGTQHHPLQNNSWVNYGMMSNELATPTILACPSDGLVKAARSFTSSPFDGFFSVAYRNASVSYFIGLDSFLTEAAPFSPGLASAALAGDRNLQVDAIDQTCSSGVKPAAGVYPSIVPPSRTRWTNAIHGLTGNILAIDGQVAQTPSSRVVQAIGPGIDDNAVFHLLMPR